MLILFLFIEVTILLDDPAGGVRDPRVHYDGQKILFAYRRGGSDNYHLHEINADGTGLRQVIRRTFVLKFSTDLARILTNRDLMSKPRKENPPWNLVTFVFSALKESPSRSAN